MCVIQLPAHHVIIHVPTGRLQIILSFCALSLCIVFEMRMVGMGNRCANKVNIQAGKLALYRQKVCIFPGFYV